MKPEAIARQCAGTDELLFRYALVTMTDALRILEQAGFVAAPKEPTEEMIVVGDHKIISVLQDNSFALKEPTVAHQVYRAMLATLQEGRT